MGITLPMCNVCKMASKEKNILKQFIPSKLYAAVIMLAALGIALLAYFLQIFIKEDIVISPLTSNESTNITPVEKPLGGTRRNLPLDKYTVVNLGNYSAKPSQIVKEKILATKEKYTSYLISFNSGNKKVTGMLNEPIADPPVGGFPVIVMVRGYVDPEIYYTGIGTERGAQVFAENGHITIAPDFFGYGESDPEAENIFESRFETYMIILDTIASVSNIKKADNSKIGIWGHSNGGQIALTVLEATQKEYPTVLWAPVTKPFPYSILYYTDEATDGGKFLRKELAKFEIDYNTDFYSLKDYLDRIKAPIQLHQGSLDEAVPQKWSDEFSKTLKEANVEVEYYIYPGADHNLMPSWNTVVERSLQFYSKYLK